MRSWKFLLAAATASFLLTAVPDGRASDYDAPEIPAALLDPVFDRYVDLNLVRGDLVAQDPSLLCDVALQMAEGERVLQRAHKSIPADSLLRLALRLAAEKRDATTMARLGKAIRSRGNAELTLALEIAQKTARGSRKIDPSRVVAVDQMSPRGFALYKSLLEEIARAKTLGDRDALEKLEKDLPDLKDLNAKQRTQLVRFIGEAKSAAPEKRDVDADALAKLAGSSRTGNRRPSSGGHRPSSGGQRPSSGGHRPSSGGQRPGGGGQRPTPRPPTPRPPVPRPRPQPQPQPSNNNNNNRPLIVIRPVRPIYPTPQPIYPTPAPYYPPDDNGGGGGGSNNDDNNAPQLSRFGQRRLRVVNSTGEKLKVYIQYRTNLGGGQFGWVPEDPDQSTNAAFYSFDPDEEAYLTYRGSPVNASRIRIWALAADGDGRWVRWQNEDLWLVTEMDDNGNRVYEASEMETYLFTFNP